MTLVYQATGALTRACTLMLERLQALEQRIESDESVWPIYISTAQALAALLPQLAPGTHGEMLTTRQMAERLGISSKTLLKKHKAGEITPALRLGARGRASIRWAGSEQPHGNGNGNALHK